MNLDRFFANKRMLILITGLTGVIVFLFIIRILTVSKTPPVTTPTPATVISSPMASASATLIPTQPVAYQPGGLKKDFDRISSKEVLSPEDQQIKQKIVTSLLGKSGVVETTAQFQIEYVKAADSFMVEVRGADTDQAKKAAEQYFLDQGLSQEGICSLPVVFYLSSRIQAELVSSGKTFNPVPEGC